LGDPVDCERVPRRMRGVLFETPPWTPRIELLPPHGAIWRLALSFMVGTGRAKMYLTKRRQKAQWPFCFFLTSEGEGASGLVAPQNLLASLDVANGDPIE